MLHVMIAQVAEGDLPRLRSWLDALPSRRDEIRESYDQQGTRQELFLLVKTRRSPLLIIASEVDDAREAAESFYRSRLPIDLEFKDLFQQISPAEAEMEILYDSTKLLGSAAA